MNAVTLRALSKTYALYPSPWDRLREAVGSRSRRRDFTALHPLSLEIRRGEVVGIVGRNGAGKSTLLSLIAGTCAPSSGAVETRGRVGAMLELGTGFHPDMTGRENIRLGGAIRGLSSAEIERLYDDIVDFAELRRFIDQPVKTYSSGMLVRLGFAVATCVFPDIFLIDEALSVGDGAFAQKSFSRFLEYKDRGSTILFCSHSMYYVEAICSRALWLDQGRLVMDGSPAEVSAAYTQSFSGPPPSQGLPMVSDRPKGSARITSIEIRADGTAGTALEVLSGKTDVQATVSFASDPELPSPTVGFHFQRKGIWFVASATTLNDGLTIPRKADGSGEVTVTFARLPLLKGVYYLHVYLFCERGLFCYEHVPGAAELKVRQEGLEQGVVSLPRQWRLE